jgi:hypothetical protein
MIISRPRRSACTYTLLHVGPAEKGNGDYDWCRPSELATHAARISPLVGLNDAVCRLEDSVHGSVFEHMARQDWAFLHGCGCVMHIFDLRPLMACRQQEPLASQMSGTARFKSSKHAGYATSLGGAVRSELPVEVGSQKSKAAARSVPEQPPREAAIPLQTTRTTKPTPIEDTNTRDEGSSKANNKSVCQACVLCTRQEN